MIFMTYFFPFVFIPLYAYFFYTFFFRYTPIRQGYIIHTHSRLFIISFLSLWYIYDITTLLATYSAFSVCF